MPTPKDDVDSSRVTIFGVSSMACFRTPSQPPPRSSLTGKLNASGWRTSTRRAWLPLLVSRCHLRRLAPAFFASRWVVSRGISTSPTPIV